MGEIKKSSTFGKFIAAISALVAFIAGIIGGLALEFLARGMIAVGGFLTLFGWNLIPMFISFLLKMAGVSVETVKTVQLFVSVGLFAVGLILTLCGSVLFAVLRA